MQNPPFSSRLTLEEIISSERPIFMKLKSGRLKTTPHLLKDKPLIISSNIIINQKSHRESADIRTAYTSNLSIDCRRKDIYGVPIIKGAKKHKVSLKYTNFEQVTYVESYKSYNVIDTRIEEKPHTLIQLNQNKEPILCRCCIIF
jgi:hypothetical protein